MMRSRHMLQCFIGGCLLTAFCVAWEQCSSEDCKQDLNEKAKVDILEAEKVLQNMGFQEHDDIQAYLRDLGTGNVRIAVAGASGSGKSTLVNTFRNLVPEDTNAAEVGVNECTTSPSRYMYPNEPTIELWDLPGINTQRFPREEYMKKINIEMFDYFLIVSSARFTADDAWLAKQIDGRHKSFSFVRTKINMDIANDKEDHPRTHIEHNVIQDVRKECIDNLKKAGVPGHDVYIIGGKHQHQLKWDYSALQEAIIKGMSDIKRHKLVLAVAATSVSHIEKKREEIQTRILIASTSSAGIATIPVPLLGIAADTAIMIEELNYYVKAFALDEESLLRFSKMYNIPQIQVKREIEKVLPYHFISNAAKWVIKLLSEVVESGVGKVFTEGAKYIPVIGQGIAASISYLSTKWALEVGADELYQCAMNIHKLAQETSLKDV